MDAAARIKIDEASIIKLAVEGTDLPCRKPEEYSPEELLTLVRLLIGMIQPLLLGESGTPEAVREALDCLLFSAKKDSRTSSMKPSSDFGRKPKDDAEPEPKGGGLPKGEAAHDLAAQEAVPDAAAQDAAAQEDGGAETDPCGEDGEKEAEARLRADHDRSRRNRSGRPVGKMKGEKGHGFKIPKRVDREEKEISIPGECRHCPRLQECLRNPEGRSSHTVYDIEFTVIKRTTVTPKLRCPKDQAVKKADAPEGAKGVNQYGTNLRTMVVLLYTAGMVSLNRIHDIIAPMFGFQLSDTTVLSAVHGLAAKVKSTVDAILDAERELRVVHCDETGARVNGKMHWIHCVASELYTFVTIQEARGKDALDAIGFLAAYVGTVVHDCLGAYWKMDEENGSLTHAVCNEHIERELAGLSKFFHNASLWADDMLSLLQEMLREKHRLMEQGASCIGREALESYSARFDALIGRGKELHPLPKRKPGQKGRLKKGRARSLVDRMEKRKDEIFRFLTDFDVPYTNNIAEASFRLLGTRKSAGAFRTTANAKDFCIIWSYLSTAKKHGHSYFEAVHEAFCGNSYKLIFPDKCSSADGQKTA